MPENDALMLEPERTRLDGSKAVYGLFEVVKIDPQGSGLEYSGHLGVKFKGARCCLNCSVVFGSDGNFGPFLPGELKALDDKGGQILKEIEQYNKRS